MLKEKIGNVKNMLIKKDVSSKKNIENLVVFLIILIITIIAINTIWKDEKKKEPEENRATMAILGEETKTIDSKIIVKTDLEKNLENILSKVNGVGEVNVLITYSESSKTEAMYDENMKENITEETDENGGKRIIKETDKGKTVVYEETNGEKIPVTEKIIMPKIWGAIIIAKGAGNIEIKSKITNAVEAATGIPVHRIQVLEME